VICSSATATVRPK